LGFDPQPVYLLAVKPDQSRARQEVVRGSADRRPIEEDATMRGDWAEKPAEALGFV